MTRDGLLSRMDKGWIGRWRDKGWTVESDGQGGRKQVGLLSRRDKGWTVERGCGLLSRMDEGWTQQLRGGLKTCC